MKYTIPCLFGLEALVADELRRLDLKNVRAENGRVHCDGGPADIPRLNINLRCGARVLVELASFPAPDFEALFQGVAAIPWEDCIPRDGEFPVKGYSISSQLHSVPACQAIVKKAAAKRLGQAYGCETLPETGDRYQIQFALIKDTAAVYLDTSGDGLYKRGYRAHNNGAPLRETLAAALVLLSRYRGRDPFCDPFCGSGTIPIEAALIARPGPALCRPKVAEPPRQAVAGRGRRGHGSRIPRPVRHLGRGHRPQCGGVEPPQRGAGGGGRLRALRGGGCRKVPPGQRLRPAGDQSALR